jgi:PAS domain S-box-containing protein
MATTFDLGPTQQTDFGAWKRVEDGHGERERNLRLFVDSIPGFVATMNPAGEFQLLNRQILKYFGKTLEELNNWTTSDIIHPDDFPRVVASFTSALETGQPYDSEHRCRRADGVYRWFQVRALPVRDTGGRILSWYLLLTDTDDRKQVEEKLRQNEKALQQIVDVIPQYINVMDSEGKVLFVNRMLVEYSGRSLEELKAGDFPAMNFPPEDAERLRDERKKGFSRGVPFELELRSRRDDGQYRWFLVRYNPLRDERGDVLRWYASATDIDDRKQAEEALRASEQSLRLVVDCIPGLVATMSPAGEMELVNRQVLKYFGKPIEELKNWATCDIVHPDDLPRVIAVIKTSIETGHPFDSEYRLRSADGTYRWFNVRSLPLTETGDSIVRWYLLHTDIDDRKQAEEKLRRSEKALQQIVDVMPQCINVMDPEGKVLYGNRMLLEYSGRSLEELKATDFPAMNFPPEDVERLRDERQKAFARGVPFERELRSRRNDGQYRWFLVRYNPLRDERGDILRWYASATDIEDRKQAEEQLRRREASLVEGQRLAHCGSWSWNVHTCEGFWSQEMFRILGYDAGETAPSLANFLERVHPEDRPRVEQVVRQEMVGLEADSPSDYRIVLPDGTIKHLHAVAHPVRNRSGEVVEVLGTSMDVTEQRLARAELEKAFEAIKHLKDRLQNENLALREQIDQEFMFEEIVGSSPALKGVLDNVRIVAPSDSTVLIHGETGTGKEMIARAIHNLSPRKGNAFIKVNCAAIPLGLLESELFGHERGAFTGAIAQRIGRFELAHKGTLFLDEVGDIPLELQPKLLRVLQEQEFERLGSTRTQRVNVRVLAATNCSLTQMVAEKKFRSDLYYRLNVFPVVVPPLRERCEDIPILVRHFANKHARQMGRKIESIPKETMNALSHYAWPGNIRELQNLMERAVLLSTGSSLRVPLGEIVTGSDQSVVSGGNALEQAERDLIVRALRESNWVVGGARGAAARLGLKRTSLAYKMQKLGISGPTQ